VVLLVGAEVLVTVEGATVLMFGAAVHIVGAAVSMVGADVRLERLCLSVLSVACGHPHAPRRREHLARRFGDVGRICGSHAKCCPFEASNQCHAAIARG
jgi:hypothetical protein